MATKNQSPEVSIVIPVYNAADTIAASIQSALNQTFEDFEIILVDDASEDNLSETLEKIKDARIKLIKHDLNQGASSARNTAIKAAQGNYIAFLDSDDIWYPQKLEKQLAFMKTANDPLLKASCTSFNVLRLSGRKRTRILEKSRNQPESLLRGCHISPGTTLMVARDIFAEDKVGLFCTQIRRLEDWDWLLRYIMNYKIEVLQDVLSEVRVSGYPRYIPVKKACDYLAQKHSKVIKRKFGWMRCGTFHASLEIEASGAAFRKRRYILAAWHMLRAFILSPNRVLRLIGRITKKLATGDYSGAHKYKKA